MIFILDRMIFFICSPTTVTNNPFLLYALSIASEHLTAEYLTSIPQTLRHSVFFSLFILPAMRLFTL